MVDETSLNIGDTVKIKLETWGRLGETKSVYKGRDIFVFGGIPQETVIVEIIRIQPSYIAAKVIEVVKGDSHRVVPNCKYFGNCTGCQYQHIEYEEQLRIKKDNLLNTLERVGGLMGLNIRDVIPCKSQYEYRNHARFTVNKEGYLGFMGKESRKFVRVNKCLLMSPTINALLSELTGKCSETRQLSIRGSSYSKDYLIQPALKNSAISIQSGQKQYTENVQNVPFKVASPSFFQVNNIQLEQIINVIEKKQLLNTSTTVVDAYSGVGTLAILLAPLVKYILGIEDSYAAVKDAEINKGNLENIHFIEGKTEIILSELEWLPDVVILDPSRKGCHESGLNNLLAIKPKVIIYVSCDPTTLARDLKILQSGYVITEIVPVDMFPQTQHLETITFLEIIYD
jgi:23S rRNA (uracil1939-C5)-methyltransferase